jgi:hypothetical protein
VSTTAIFFANSLPFIVTTSLLSRYIVPLTSESCLAILFKIVDLPAPFGPINVRISPLFREKSIFSISGLLSYPTASFCAVK